jgi:hypothetical protein
MSDQGMDCSSIRDALLAGSPPTGSGLDAHLRECEACSELLRNSGDLARAFSKAEAPAAPNPELWKSLEGALAAEKGPRAWLRSRATPVRLFVVALVAGAVVFVGGQPVDETVPPVEVTIGWLVGFALAAFACLSVLVAPLGRPRPPRIVLLPLVVVALVLPLAYALLGAAPSNRPGSFAEQAIGCFAFGTILSLPFFGVVWAFERSDRPWLTRLVGVGAVAGLVANAALALHCPNTEMGHLVLGHAAIGVALASIGAIWAVARTRFAS